MCSSLEITPKGIYKPNDDNPKVIEFEEEVKVPEFSELSSIETWVHRNPNLLNVLLDLSSSEDTHTILILRHLKIN